MRKVAVAFAMFFAALTISCHGKKSVSKSNFRKVIQASLDKKPGCLIVSLPKSVPDVFGKPRTDAQDEALVAIGLAAKRHGRIQERDVFGPPETVFATLYEITAEGRKYFPKQQSMQPALHFGPTAELCYGTPEVVDIVRYSEPGTAMGSTVTEVEYTYGYQSLPPWVKDPRLERQFLELQHVPTLNSPASAKATLELMNDGWQVYDPFR